MPWEETCDWDHSCVMLLEWWTTIELLNFCFCRHICGGNFFSKVKIKQPTASVSLGWTLNLDEFWVLNTWTWLEFWVEKLYSEFCISNLWNNGKATLSQGNGIASRCAKREFLPLIPNSNWFRDQPDIILTKVKSGIILVLFQIRTLSDEDEDLLSRTLMFMLDRSPDCDNSNSKIQIQIQICQRGWV